jgi:hypothetical protein
MVRYAAARVKNTGCFGGSAALILAIDGESPGALHLENVAASDEHSGRARWVGSDAGLARLDAIAPRLASYPLLPRHGPTCWPEPASSTRQPAITAPP